MAMSFGFLGRRFGRLGGGKAGASAPDTTAPTITSANSANCAENVTLSHTLTADEGVSWSIVGGSDQARFEISGSTLRWLSNGTKNFEAPDDSDTNNTYVVTVRATDTALNTTDQTITITVTDVAEGGSAAYIYRGSGSNTVGGSVATFSIDIGTASADRLVIVASAVSAATTIDSVVVNGVTLTADISAVNSYRVAIHSGLVTVGDGAQNVVLTWGSASFQEKNAFVWTATGLASNLVKQTVAFSTSPGSINVTAGDFLFAAGRSVALFPDFATSTEAPDATRQIGLHSTGADWTVNATNAAFSVNPGASNNQQVAASYI